MSCDVMPMHFGSGGIIERGSCGDFGTPKNDNCQSSGVMHSNPFSVVNGVYIELDVEPNTGLILPFNRRWQNYFFKIAKVIASQSKDPNTQVGAVCVDPQSKRILNTGYNGFPSGVDESSKRWERPAKYDRVVHAEANCVAAAARFGVRLADTAIFITHPPCTDCTKLLISAGIRYIYYLELADDSDSGAWKEKLQIAESMCVEAHVARIAVNPKFINLE